MHRSPHEIVPGRKQAMDVEVGDKEPSEERAAEHGARSGPLAPRDGRVVEAREREEILDDEPIDGVLVLRLESVADISSAPPPRRPMRKAHDTQRAARRRRMAAILREPLEDRPNSSTIEQTSATTTMVSSLSPDRAAEAAEPAVDDEKRTRAREVRSQKNMKEQARLSMRRWLSRRCLELPRASSSTAHVEAHDGEPSMSKATTRSMSAMPSGSNCSSSHAAPRHDRSSARPRGEPAARRTRATMESACPRA